MKLLPIILPLLRTRDAVTSHTAYVSMAWRLDACIRFTLLFTPVVIKYYSKLLLFLIFRSQYLSDETNFSKIF